jgi:hypothetical protein
VQVPTPVLAVTALSVRAAPNYAPLAQVLALLPAPAGRSVAQHRLQRDGVPADALAVHDRVVAVLDQAGTATPTRDARGLDPASAMTDRALDVWLTASSGSARTCR